MFLIFSNNLNENEILLLDKLLFSAGITSYNHFCVNKDTLPSRDIADSHIIILVYDKTKSKPTLIKKLEEFYGHDYLGLNFVNAIKSRDKVIELDRPNTFQKNEALREKNWNIIKSLASYIDRKKLLISALPIKLPEALHDIITKSGPRPVYHFPDIDLEIRPSEILPSRENSLTYDEFIILVSSRFLFNFDKAEILST